MESVLPDRQPSLLTLRRRGSVFVRVIPRWWIHDPPNGMNVLEEIGLVDSLFDNGARVSEFCFRDRSGKVLARFVSKMS
jgi:hypothetical protein